VKVGVVVGLVTGYYGAAYKTHGGVHSHRPVPHRCSQPRAKAACLCTMVNLTLSRLYQGPHLNLWFLAFCLMISSTLAQSATPRTANVLLYSATKGFRHDSISTAIESLKSRSGGRNIVFDNTEDLTWFREDRLKKYDAIVFLLTTGEGESCSGLCAAQTDVLCSPRCRRQDCLSELPQQRGEFCRGPLCKRHPVHH